MATAAHLTLLMSSRGQYVLCVQWGSRSSQQLQPTAKQEPVGRYRGLQGFRVLHRLENLPLRAASRLCSRCSCLFRPSPPGFSRTGMRVLSCPVPEQPEKPPWLLLSPIPLALQPSRALRYGAGSPFNSSIRAAELAQLQSCARAE